MKKLFFLLFIGLVIIFLFDRYSGCTRSEMSEEDFEKEVLHIEVSSNTDTLFLSQDSILKLADKVMDHIKRQEESQENMVKEMEKQKINEKLSQEQIIFLQKEELEFKQKIYEQRSYIDELSKPTDTVIYNIQYKDTQICKPVYIPDTVYITIEIVDTIKIKKKKKKKKT